MTWTIVADEIWSIRPLVVAVLAFFYLVPLLKIVLSPIHLSSKIFIKLNILFGIFEHAVGLFRDIFISFFLIAGSAWHIWRGFETHTNEDFIIAGSAILIAASGFLFRYLRKRSHLELLEWVVDFPTTHPKDFFNRLFCSSGIFNVNFTEKPSQIIDPVNVNFTNGRKSKFTGVFNLLLGLWSTIWITKLANVALDKRGVDFLRKAVSSLAIIWGSRICQISKARVIIENTSKIPNPAGPRIYLFTHKSFFDFAIAPFVLATAAKLHNCGSSSENMPLFLLAKDHFKDNFIFYRLLGIGKIAEALGMIFVDRKKTGDISKAKQTSVQAAQTIISGKSIAIFPQGSRAYKFTGINGERQDAGYYTVGSKVRIKTYGGHLKKGAAHIATQTANELASKASLVIPEWCRLSSSGSTRGSIIKTGSPIKAFGDGSRLCLNPLCATGSEVLKIIPVAISGSATVCPKGSIKIHTNTTIKMIVGDAIEVNASNKDYNQSVRSLHEKIDISLKSAQRIHGELERRFFEEIRKTLDAAKIDEISLAMKPWREKDYLVHSILDAIYACHPEKWRGFIGELAFMLLDFKSREELVILKARIVEELN